MSDLVTRVNQTLESAAPAWARSLSPLGRRVVMPAGIPVQAREARDAELNGTIGQLTDGHGSAMTLPALERAMSLERVALDRAFLYSPVAGFTELRERWRDRQRRDAKRTAPSSLPLVTCGLTHSLSILADLFAGEGRKVLLPSPYWGNYDHVFATRTGARMVSAPAFVDGEFHCNFAEAAAETAELEDDEPVIVMLNLPSNPGGYSATVEERERIAESLLRLAEHRPTLVICDDAYAGLVYEPEIPRRSMFWELTGRHPQLLPVKVDGATKELTFFGGRVGFLTFPFEPGAPAAEALESKAMGLVRSTVGSPVAASQAVVLEALQDEALDEQFESVRKKLEGRYRALARALAELDRDLLRPQPFNSGSFALLELEPELGLEAGAVRRHLLEQHGAGLIAIGSRYLRIAHCSVDAEQLPELVRRLERGVEELACRV